MSFTDSYSVSSTMLGDGHSNSDCIAGTSEQPIQRSLNCAELENRGAAGNLHETNCVYTQLSILPNESLFGKLYESLALETKFQPSLFLPEDSNNGEVTVGARDGAAHVLRCLKMWYDFPSDVLFVAVNLVDRFLSKMKVRPKHMACISVGSFLLAARQLKLNIADTDDLVCISQCRCTSGDVERMSTIIASKLGVHMETVPITPLTFLRIFHIILHRVAVELNLQSFFESTMIFHDLVARLEILACEASCASMRASELALALICTHMDEMIAAKFGTDNDEQVQGLIQYAIQMQQLCKITEQGFFETHKIVVSILEHYNGQQKLPHRQRLVWKLSSRTMRVLRPTDRLTSHLPTIEEDNNHNPLRSRTGSVCSEDGDDWPTSPMLAIYEK